MRLAAAAIADRCTDRLLAIDGGSNAKASGGQVTRIRPTVRQPPPDFFARGAFQRAS